MTPNFGQDYFSLFGAARTWRLDEPALDRAYHDLQSQVHPDRYAHLSDTERRLSMQWATRVNEAYRTLRNPLTRARYLLELHGADMKGESNTTMSAEFLMEQMEWREAVESAREADDVEELEKLWQRVRHQTQDMYAGLERELDVEHNHHAAAERVRRLMFMEKLRHEIEEAIEALEE